MKISRFTTDEISMLKEKCNFSETELRCFELKAKDYTNTQITFELGMSSSSVAIAMRRIREKITFVMERHIQEMHSSTQPEGCNGSGCPVYHTMQEWARIPDSLSIRGRMYIYGDYRTDEDVSIPRIKIGDGVTPISALPFATMSITNSDMERWDGRSEFDGNNLGDVMWIDSSATIDKPFTFHTDGYIVLVFKSSKDHAQVNIHSASMKSFFIFEKPTDINIHSKEVFVRKGMKCVHVSSSDGAKIKFVPLV